MRIADLCRGHRTYPRDEGKPEYHRQSATILPAPNIMKTNLHRVKE